jgi:hypothetical protein
MVQPFACSQGVLAHGRVCKPFAHERWQIRNQRWSKASCLRTERWPTSARVCKPDGFCSQAATPTTGEFKQHQPDAYATGTMADGSEVLAPIFLGTIGFPVLDENVAEMVGVTVTVLGDQALIGQSVLKHFTLTLDHGRQVILEP